VTGTHRLWAPRTHGADASPAPTVFWTAGSGLRFTEGFDTRDLKEAKALLEELASKGVRSSACDSVNQRQQWPNHSQIEKVTFSKLRAA
jgi:hypothetical protein